MYILFKYIYTHICAPGSSVHGDSPGRNTGVGCHALVQGIFPTQGSKPGPPHCRQILYHMNHQGSTRILEWVVYPFSRETSQPRNWTRVSCIAGRFFTSWATWETHIYIGHIYIYIYIAIILLLCSFHLLHLRGLVSMWFPPACLSILTNLQRTCSTSIVSVLGSFPWPDSPSISFIQLKFITCLLYSRLFIQHSLKEAEWPPFSGKVYSLMEQTTCI